jgi:hypothetical protein
MSETPAKQSSQAPPPKGRNPIERIAVYGFMVVLLVLVGVEAKGMFAHKAAVNALQALLQAREADSKLPEVTEADVKTIMGSRQPSRTEDFQATNTFAASKKLEIYSWFTLNPLQKREIWVKYGRRGLKETGPAAVVSMSTDDQEVSAGSQEIGPAAGKANDPGFTPMGGGPGATPPVGGPPGGRGPGGPPRAHTAEPPDGKPAGDKSTDEKPADSKPADDKPADEKKPDAEGEKPAPQQ